MSKINIKLLTSLFFIIISIIGIIDAGYLTYEKIVGVEVTCGNGFDCGEVLNSRWANIGPIPLSALGLLFYFFVFIFSVIHFLEINIQKKLESLLHTLKVSTDSVLYSIQPFEIIFVFSVIGFLFSAFLVFLMAFIIKAWCLFCLISATSSTLLLLTSSLYYVHEGYKKSVFIKLLIYFIEDITYRLLLKPLFFLFNPLTVHNQMVAVGKQIGKNYYLLKLLTIFFSFNHPKLSKNIMGIQFANPVGLSAGFDYNADLIETLPSIGFGFHTVGTITLEAYDGNSGAQLIRLPASKSILVNKGLKNIGARKIIQKLEKKDFKIPVGISIASTNKQYKDIKEQIYDICMCFKLFEMSRVNHSYYELNISCPNTFGGEPFTTPKRLRVLIYALEKIHISKPVFVKMPIDQSETETLELLHILDKTFVAGVIFGNLTKDKTNPDVHSSDRITWKNNKGNLSGKPTWKKSNKLISLTKKHFKNRFVIIGTGGIFSAEDAEIKLRLGADLVQLITGMVYTGPQLIGKINHYVYRNILLKQQSMHLRTKY